MFTLTLVSLLLASSNALVSASPCVAFDINWNLLAFGLDGKDFNAGAQSSWSSGKRKASEITTSGRPPFDGTNTTCYLSQHALNSFQYENAIYVMSADSKNPSDVYIYDATAKSWSAQTVTTNGFDPSNFAAILDHDTNVFYAMSANQLWNLDMSQQKAATGSALSWNNVGNTPYPSGYNPVMVIANNHIHFLDVPNLSPGQEDIFVIHYSWYQPSPQAYPVSGGNGAVPNQFGHATSFFMDDNTVQQNFAFVPQDGSATYVVNVMSNSTTQMAGPSTKDPKATYFASSNSLVQLTSSGAANYLPFNPSGSNSDAKWAPIQALAAAAPPSSTSASSGSSPTGSSGSGSSGSSSSGSGSGSASGSSSGSPSSGSRFGFPSCS
ncbi:hypothetical protein CONPUDRAFT_62794 [Coniophora puteana RWD-64-598 SS2]|uniref:Uncharacterized protein n=1 Tax=Coniophora puteana (strain RWD-64-598) TaxID=741705 RepID=A0A5M3MDP7_CONPW|nr:uncharacterized protein CONPUDRAFT_62794 [Coniophora puteana RWD-64-598 SS2]EIW77167.1 hypothetical protein CONPUDRAFT_62794 [Coniophora puteana RWD-64-598 SS2]